MRLPVLFSIVMIIVNITVVKVTPVGVMGYCSGRSQRHKFVVQRSVSSNAAHQEVNKYSSFLFVLFPLSFSSSNLPLISTLPLRHFLLFIFLFLPLPLFLLFLLSFFVFTFSSSFSSYLLSLIPTLPLRRFIPLIFLLHPIFLLFLLFFFVV